MHDVTGTRHFAAPDNRTEFKRWRLGRFIVLSYAVLIALVAFTQQPPTKVSIRPAGPMPGVSIP